MPVDTGPDKIGRYEIQSLIARGGMGRVYLARDPNTSRLVVVKLLDATLDSSDVRDRFDREAKSLASLSHPNIVHIYDYGDFQESPFIVMEYVRGETLEEKIRRRAPLPLSDKLGLMTEVCAGLAHAHEAGIVHRDVKPANLMVDQDGRVKILDFGIARVADSSLTRGYSQGGWGQLRIGTPGYMSPEQTRGDDIDHRTDIFSIGAVCYELLAYREAFPGATPDQIESKVMRTPPEPLAVQLPGLDPEIDQIIARALAQDPNDRYQDAAALKEAFERCRLPLAPSNGATSSRRPTPPAGPMSRPPGSRADAAYARAAAAYEERAFDLARRLLIEALAEDPAHAGARALQARLDPPPPARVARPAPVPRQYPAAASMRSARQETRGEGPETISVDPTVLIERASRSPEPDQIDPTVLIQRDDLLRRLADAEPQRSAAPSSRPGRTASEPTVLITPKQRPASFPPKTPFPRGAFLLPLWLRVKTLGRRPPSPPRRQPPAKGAARRPGGRWTPSTRGTLIAVAAVAVAFLFVLGAIQIGAWMWPAGELLTLSKPVGGTIVGSGLSCGTGGSDCTATLAVGETVQLRAEPDPEYVWSSFTGDCAPKGRITMTQARTCGATFDRVAQPKALTWRLTIVKPTGGTVLVAGGIECGTLGTTCSSDLGDGLPATVIAQADPGYEFVRFTGDCDEKGETTMTTARTCGAEFIESSRPKATSIPRQGPSDPATPKSRTDQAKASTTVANTPPAEPVQPPPGPADPSGAPSRQEPQVPTDSDPKPASEAITRDAHAKAEIEQLIKNYCAALETRKPERVKEWFPLVNEKTLRKQFEQYKSLRCTVIPPKEYAQFDAGPAGAAQFKFEMKQILQSRVAGPETHETIVTMKVSRTDLRSPWLIDRATHETKPKD
jgi:predicted Ser/Thr protein kinase